MRTIPQDYEAKHSLTVTQAMTVDFEQNEPGLGKLHPVYATYWLGKHVELVSRKLTLAFLEEHEEGIGFELNIKHIASALPGMTINLTATHQKTQNTRVYISCVAHNELGDKIAEATTTQVILPKEDLNSKFKTLEERWAKHKQTRVS